MADLAALAREEPPDASPQGIIGWFVGKLVEITWLEGGKATGRLQAFGGGVILIDQLDGRRRVIAQGSYVSMVEAGKVQ